jgi:hypothetical protein
MVQPDILAANFTISAAARAAAARLRSDYDAQFPDDPAAVLSVGWGIATFESGGQAENVILSFYPRSMLAEVSHGIQEVSGVKLIFFTTRDYLDKFAGKVLDHVEDGGFFMRAPNVEPHQSQ